MSLSLLSVFAIGGVWAVREIINSFREAYEK